MPATGINGRFLQSTAALSALVGDVWNVDFIHCTASSTIDRINTAQ